MSVEAPSAPTDAGRAGSTAGGATAPATPAWDRLERILGDLAVEELLAHTARTAVYRVRIGGAGNRPLALKVALQPSDAEDLVRFRHEARLLSEVRHPNVVEVREVGVLPGDLPFLVMELVEPFDRGALGAGGAEAGGLPSWERVYELALQAAAGLAHIHRLGIVHLDVKPANLGFSRPADGGEGGGHERRLKILDFGLAQDLRDPLDRRIRGTLAYMAPEVLLQDAWDHRADLYSLGLTLVEIACGTLPSAAATAGTAADEAAIRFHLERGGFDPRTLRPGMPEELAGILERLLRSDPRERPSSAGRLLEELGRAAGRPVEPAERTRLTLGPDAVLTSRLVGRERELRRLTDALEDARRGHPRVVLVEGEEGVGKSRLLREFRLLATVEGARVGFGRAEGEPGRPLWPVRRALRNLGIEIEPQPARETPGGEDGGRFVLFREISRRLAEIAGVEPAGAETPEGRAAEAGEGEPGTEPIRPLVVVLDDLHLAGEDVSALLRFLAGDLGRARVLVVGGRRPVTEEDAVEDDTRERLDLRPLDRAASARLAEACLGLDSRNTLPERVLDWLEEHGGGLPGRIQQLLRHAIEEGALEPHAGDPERPHAGDPEKPHAGDPEKPHAGDPEKPHAGDPERPGSGDRRELPPAPGHPAAGWAVRPAVLERLAQGRLDVGRQRLDALPPALRDLLEVAAVPGAPFRLETAAHLLGESRERVYPLLDALVARGFLERSAEQGAVLYTFADRSLSRSLYAFLEEGRRTALHRQLAEHLVDTAAAAGSEVSAETAAEVAEHLWRAGERRRSLPYLLAAAGHAAAVHGHAEAAGLYRRAVEAAEEAGDLDAARRAALGRARGLDRSGHPGRALRIYQRLVGEVGESTPELAGRVALEKGRLHGRLGEHETALATFDAGLRAVAGAGPPPPPGEVAGGLLELELGLRHGRAVALRDLGRAEAAFTAARSALARAGEAGLRRQRAFLLNTLSRLFYARGDWKRAGRLARRGLRLVDPAVRSEDGPADGEDRRLAVLLRNSLANVRWKTGDFASALRLFEDNFVAWDELGDPWGQLTALNNLGILRCSLGDWKEARRLLMRTLSMTRRLGARDVGALARINLAEVDDVLGDWRRSRSHAQRALDLLRGPAGLADRTATLVQIAALDRKTGRLGDAERRLDEALAGALEVESTDLESQVLLQRALLETDRGRFAEAADLLRRTLELARAADTAELLARILLAAAETSLEGGDRQAAREHAAEARRQAEELGDRLTEGRLLAVEARLEGDPERFAEAVRRLEDVGAEHDLARALYHWGVTLPGSTEGGGDPGRARVEQALARFEALGAEPDARRARAFLAGRIGSSADAGDSAMESDDTLYEVMKIINSTLDQDEVLHRTMDLALERLGGQRGMVVLTDQLTRELEVRVARNIGGDSGGTDDGDPPAETEERKLSESVVRRVIESGEPVLSVDAVADHRFAGSESIVASDIRSILCVPLVIRDERAGAIYVDHCRSRHLFGQRDLEFLQAFADGAAVAIDNARLYGELAEARERLKAENESLRREMLASRHLGSLIGRSGAISELKKTLERVAQSSSTVLIRGESGTGKGLVARIIHHVSPRRKGPFIHFNCAALPETLVESELFGHEKGAFTGATDKKPGRFELADGGTIFLDEIGKISASVQAKLLRVVEEKEFERVGGTRTLRSDVRIITATNLDLEAAITRSAFREDLYYRLNIIPIVLPPLRERREDVPLLMRHFMTQISGDLGQPEKRFDRSVLELFERHSWPGNVRELESAIHRALVLAPVDCELLTADDFRWIAAAGGDGDHAAVTMPEEIESLDLSEGGYQRAMDTLDRRLIEAALAETGGVIRETARMLGIARNTLKSKMKRYGIEP